MGRLIQVGYSSSRGLAGSAGLPPARQPDPPAAVTYSYTASTAIFSTPGCGFFQYTETHYAANDSGYVPLSSVTLAATRASTGRAVVFRYFVMEKFLTLDTLDTVWLNLVAADLAAVRAAGCTAIIRFTYSTSGNIGSPPYNADPPLARILGHITQLGPVVNTYADVVDAVQAGFIGMWGEWYYTDNFGDLGSATTQQMTDRLQVLTALLSALDPRVFVLLRYPGLKARWLGSINPARVGYHDDAFQAPFDDYGTWTTFSLLNAVDTRAFVVADTAVPVGGESATVNAPDTLGANSISELAALHASFLNPDYHPDVLASWTTAERDTVARNLGFRLRLTTATLPARATAGAGMPVTFTIANDGFSRPLRARPVQVVFTSGSTAVARTLAVDARSFTPGTTVVSEQVIAPPAGVWSVHLLLPDADAGLSGRAEFAVQLANAGGWDAATGRNALGHSVTVT